jgi:hypothetical protein
MHTAPCSNNLLALLGRILAALATLNNRDHLVDGVGLLLPLALAHFEFLLEELVVGLAVAAAETVPQRGELTVVVVEVQVVHGVARCAVDNG